VVKLGKIAPARRVRGWKFSEAPLHWGVMSFSFQQGEAVSEAIRRLVTEQLDKAIANASRPQVEAAEAIHEVRKSCKRIRAVLRLIQPQEKKLARAENAAIRDMARDLSSLRDVQVARETLTDLMAHAPEKPAPDEARAIRQALGLTHAVGRKNSQFKQKVGQFCERALEARTRAAHWKITGTDFTTIGNGLQSTYKKGRTAMREALKHREDILFHEWRKRVKDYGYHLTLLKAAWPPALKRLGKEVDELGEILGQRNDLWLLRNRLLEKIDPAGHEAFWELLNRRQRELDMEAQQLGARIYAEHPKSLMQRIKTYWKIWQAEALSHDQA